MTAATQNHTIHSLFSLFKDYRHILLVFSLGIWIVCPLAGVALLLIHSQVNVSTNYLAGNRQNLSNIFSIVVVLFTLTTYISSFEPFEDTVVYLDVYRRLEREQFSIWSDLEFEPVSFIIPKCINILTSGNELSFLFVQTLTINLVLTACTIFFFSRFYPLIILINAMTAGYYFQLFWMRQFYSFIFIIPAVCISNASLTILLFIVSFYTHNSSLFYFLPLFFRTVTEKIYGIEQYFVSPLKKLFGPKLLIFTTLLGLVALLPLLWNSSLGFLGSTVFTDGSASQKLNDYAGDATDLTATFNQDAATLRAQLRVIIDYIVILLFAFGADFQQVNSVFYRWLFLFFTMFLGYLGAILFGFNLRINSLFFCLPGFFYMIPLYSGKMVGKFNVYTGAFLFSLAFRFSFFFYSLMSSYRSGSYLTFWDGNPLFTPITSYFELFFKSIASFLI